MSNDDLTWAISSAVNILESNFSALRTGNKTKIQKCGITREPAQFRDDRRPLNTSFDGSAAPCRNPNGEGRVDGREDTTFCAGSYAVPLYLAKVNAVVSAACLTSGHT
ncbi:MAG: hypothetical protein WA418_15715 [Bradyrhizobium sp.]